MNGQAADRPVRGVSSLFMTHPGLLVMIFFLLIAVINRQTELIVLCILTLAIAGCARLWAAFSGRSVEFSARLSLQKTFPEEEVSLEISCENKKLLPVSVRVVVPVDKGLGPETGNVLSGESGLLSYEEASFSWSFSAGYRGVYDVGPVEKVTGDLFGFFDCELPAGEKLELIVYPRILPVKPLEILRREFFGTPGVKSPVNDPVYIMGTREYLGGRPAKYIHWKASARHNKLQEKIFEPTEQEKVLFLIDAAGYVRENARPEFEKMLEGVASFAAGLDRRGVSFGLVANCLMRPAGLPVLPVAYSRDQLPRLLETAARMKMEAASGLPDILGGIILPAGISCVFFSLYRDHLCEVFSEHFKDKKVPFMPVLSRPAGSGGAGKGPGPVIDINEVFL